MGQGSAPPDHLHVERTGTGSPIVFSHSLFFDLTMFDHQAAFFGADHHVVRYDHRGQGRSAASGQLDIDTLTGDAAALIESLGVDYERFTFVDLGSGKGRALLIASEYAFHAIVGVEMSPRLHAIAAANIAAYRGTAQRCRDVRSMEADATKFVFPAGPLVIYLWNPFEAPVFRIVLANLEASLAREPRDIFILYIHPELDGLFDASGCWRKLWRESIPMSEEDYAAHAFPSKTEVCSVYQSVSAS